MNEKCDKDNNKSLSCNNGYYLSFLKKINVKNFQLIIILNAMEIKLQIYILSVILI